MSQRTAWLLMIIVLLAGCSAEAPPGKAELKTQRLHEFYPGSISNVEAVEILDGSTGDRKLISDELMVRDWINQVKDMIFVPDPNQEGRTGFLYEVSLFEGEERKLSFTPSAVGGHYYLHNEKLLARVEALFQGAGGKSQ
ncbi:hypothetical protein DNH61_24505 [Paenibacillus sambharensis]|uniref:Lipoprotein n=1 Tax=Paenibacillus sambharensis TaxID=1803190 RepID=A0A2W1L4U0_9BACL|nr:hypothetical protein [Paenibacillus sambharensis]PZD93210.1 hypothetical protein DNH61_24505 [Paenibacillus sambharensis]